MRLIPVLVAMLGLVFLHTHTDEIPVVLGSVLTLSAVVSGMAPRNWLVNVVLLGSALPLAEILVRRHVLAAPWPVGPGFPWAALTGYVSAVIGVSIGSGARGAVAPSAAT